MSIAMEARVAELERELCELKERLRSDATAVILADDAAAMKRIEAHFSNIFQRKPGPKPKEQS